MNKLFAELYDAYRMQVMHAKDRGEDLPPLLFCLSRECFVSLMQDNASFNYIGHGERTIFGIPFVERRQVAPWALYRMVDAQH